MTKKMKRTTLPERYEAGFLQEMDRRTEVYKLLRRNFNDIVEDSGGSEKLSHTKLALIERFVFLEACLQTWESRIASNPKLSDHLLGRWIQGLNALTGLSKTIGLSRERSKVLNLKTYVQGRGQ